MAIPGTYEHHDPNEGKVCSGEAGLHDLTIPLTPIRFHGLLYAEAFAQELLAKACPDDAIECPCIVVNRRFLPLMRGCYRARTKTVSVSSPMHLRVLVHEIAHHVCHATGVGRGHSQGFKAVLRRLLRTTYEMLERPLPKRGCVTYRPKAQDIVQVRSPRNPFRGLVQKVGRTRAIVMDVETLNRYSVRFELLEKV